MSFCCDVQYVTVEALYHNTTARRKSKTGEGEEEEVEGERYPVSKVVCG